MKGGRDKGYDTFIAAAALLAERYADIHFHVVGPWGVDDGDVSSLADRVRFYGSQPSQFFPKFYSRMDAILSPNIPFVLDKGFFDGFPTGACMEAGMCGVPVICSDGLQLNTQLRDGVDVVLVEPSATSYADAVAKYREDRDAWLRLSEATTHSFRRVFGLTAQMAPRLQLLTDAFGLA
jgi:glycosyltransferase involved in cell wall biosynthesis